MINIYKLSTRVKQGNSSVLVTLNKDLVKYYTNLKALVKLKFSNVRRSKINLRINQIKFKEGTSYVCLGMPQKQVDSQFCFIVEWKPLEKHRTILLEMAGRKCQNKIRHRRQNMKQNY